MAGATYASMLALLILFWLAGDSEVPSECRTHDALRTTMCAAKVRIAALTHLRDDDVSVLAVELAAAPTLAILDEVIATQARQWQVIALRLRGNLYIAMAVRMRQAGATSSRVSPWLARARRAYSDARTLAAGLRGAKPRAEENNP